MNSALSTITSKNHIMNITPGNSKDALNKFRRNQNKTLKTESEEGSPRLFS